MGDPRATLKIRHQTNLQPGQDITRFTRARLGRIRQRLLGWYREQHRRLPWRVVDRRTGRPKPYRVLVSEVMLQQTQVATVVGYFHRFLGLFPTVEALAEADEQQVLTAWQGLGYYRRARQLHETAKRVVADHRGRIPPSAEQLETLPGIGRSTAGAVASIAFGLRAPILDGNVARVLVRIEGIDQPVDLPEVRRRLWGLSGQLVQGDDPGNTNQALMELGAVICLPRKPRCTECPVRRSCKAFRHGNAALLPNKVRRRPPKAVNHHVVAIHRAGRYLFQCRPERGLWSKMWQMPTHEGFDIEPSDALELWVKGSFGLSIAAPKKIDRFTHLTTHRKICFTVWSAASCAGRLRRGTGVWRGLDQLDDLPLPNPHRRAVGMVALHVGGAGHGDRRVNRDDLSVGSSVAGIR